MLKHVVLFTLLTVLLLQSLEAKKLKEKPKPDVKQQKHEQAPQESLNHHSPPHQEFLHENNQPDVEPQHQEKQQLVKPKSLKSLTQYEQCKLECKRQRDQESAQEYVERLRDELRQAEELLAKRDDHVIEL